MKNGSMGPPDALEELQRMLPVVFKGSEHGPISTRTVIEIQTEFPRLPKDTPEEERTRTAEDIWARADIVVRAFPGHNITFRLINSSPRTGEARESSFAAWPIPLAEIVPASQPPTDPKTHV